MHYCNWLGHNTITIMLYPMIPRTYRGYALCVVGVGSNLGTDSVGFLPTTKTTITTTIIK